MSRNTRKPLPLTPTETNNATTVSPALPQLLTARNFSPDPVQLEVLSADPHRCAINCCRQWGKSTITAVKAIHTATTKPNSLTLVLSPSARQSGEFLRKASKFLTTPEIQTKSDRHLDLSLVLPNQSRIVGLPAKEETTRGFSSADLLIVDVLASAPKASRVSDSLYQAIRPALAASDGQIWLISTPAGRRGFFYEACSSPASHWTKIEIPATRCTRIKPRFLEEERAHLSAHLFRQEYLCEFLDDEDAIFPAHFLASTLVARPSLPFERFLAYTDHTIYQNDVTFCLGLDLGQSHDYSAISVIEAAKVIAGPRSPVDFSIPTKKRFTVRHLERLPLRTPYTDVVLRVVDLLRHPSLGDYKHLMIDATGVGRPIVDMLREHDFRSRVHPVTITAGDTASRQSESYRIPRSQLLSNLQISFQANRLDICRDLPLAQTLLAELANLHGLDFSPHDPKIHDDLVFATALANWRATEKL